MDYRHYPTIATSLRKHNRRQRFLKNLRTNYRRGDAVYA